MCLAAAGDGIGGRGPHLLCRSLALLADFASRRMLRLCVAAIPGSTLPTAEQLLSWIEPTPPALGLLLDADRLAPGADTGLLIRRAGARLGGVIVEEISHLSHLRQALEDAAFQGGLLVRGEKDA